MSAYEIPSLRFSGIAAEAITRRRFIKATTESTFSMADAGEVVVGVSMNDPASDEVLEIADGIVMVEAGETVAVGANVQSGTNGVAMTLASGKLAGTCLTGGDVGEMLTIKTTI